MIVTPKNRRRIRCLVPVPVQDSASDSASGPEGRLGPSLGHSADRSGRGLSRSDTRTAGSEAAPCLPGHSTRESTATVTSPRPAGSSIGFGETAAAQSGPGATDTNSKDKTKS